MCFSFEVSIITGLVSYVIAYYLWKRNLKYDRWFSIIIFTYSTMQWLDAMLWYDKKHNSTASNLNKFISTYLIPFVIGAIFLSIIVGAKYKKYKIGKVEFSVYIACAIGIFLVLSNGFGLYGTNTTTINKKCHLDWGIKRKWSVLSFLFWIVLMILPLRFIETKAKVVVAIAVIIPLLLVYTTKYSIGSLWCALANSLSLLVLLYPYI